MVQVVLFYMVELLFKAAIIEGGVIKGSSLKKPHSIKWKLDGHSLVVSWQHLDEPETLLGYYISLCQIKETRCTAPDFVHFSNEVLTAEVVGLAPGSSYSLQVFLTLLLIIHGTIS